MEDMRFYECGVYECTKKRTPCIVFHNSYATISFNCSFALEISTMNWQKLSQRDALAKMSMYKPPDTHVASPYVDAPQKKEFNRFSNIDVV